MTTAGRVEKLEHQDEEDEPGDAGQAQDGRVFPLLSQKGQGIAEEDAELHGLSR
jgi:hypothetical protein